METITRNEKLENTPPEFKPLVVGEVLFDHFPDGNRVLGGAPFNVAWNLQGWGLAPRFVSAVGADSEGEAIRTQMEAWGLDTAGLQVAEDWPTGRVQVELNSGQPEFQILDQQAYDHIRFPTFPVSPANFSLLYTGSLAYRNKSSRSTLRRLIAESGLPRFIDINIRQPWFDRAWLPELLGDAHWIKLSDQELAWVTQSKCRSGEEICAAVEKLRAAHGGQQYFVTCGSAGAYAVDENLDALFAEAPTPEPLVDTVGAGDAFSAALIVGLSQGKPLSDIMQFAVRFASRACTIHGATTRDADHFADLPSNIH